MKSKVYPKSEPLIRLKDGSLGAVYKGSVVCMLDHSEVEFLNSILELIMDNMSGDTYEELEKEFDIHSSILKAGCKRMEKFHEFMGAFDSDGDSKLTKPDSEKIDWSKHEAKLIKGKDNVVVFPG